MENCGEKSNSKSVKEDSENTCAALPLERKHLSPFEMSQRLDALLMLQCTGFEETPENIERTVMTLKETRSSTHLRGLDTMIVVDVSESMEGQPLAQVKTFLTNFLNVGLTSGGKTPLSLALCLPYVYRNVKLKSHLLDMLGRVSSMNFKIQTVPVGDADHDLLRHISELTGGRSYSIQESHLLSSYLKFQMVVSRIIPDALSSENLEAEQTLRGKAINLMLSNPGLIQEERNEVLKLTAEALKADRENPSRRKKGVEFEDLPQIGMRVRRGPDWNRGNEDSGGVGTIIGHSSRKSLWVQWDVTNNKERYRYGVEDLYDLLLVDEPRVLTVDDLILVGTVVKRGPDWKPNYLSQDGGPGQTGIVFKVTKSGQCHVRWFSGYKNVYNYGNEGRFELEIISPRESNNVSDTSIPESAANSSSETNVNTESSVSLTGTNSSAQNSSPNPPQSVNISNPNMQMPPRINISQGQTGPEEMTTNMAAFKKSNQTQSPKNMELPAASNLPHQPLVATEDISCAVWQWLDAAQQWQTYPAAVNDRIEKDYNRNPSGSSLIQGRNARIIFSKMLQRDKSNQEQKVRRHICSTTELQQYRKSEES
ncbi:hypothetical protein ScPMuIL_018456 [Solemya velum]